MAVSRSAGTVTGLRTRGGVTVEHLAWADGTVGSACLVAAVDTTVEVRWTDRHRTRRTRRLSLLAGERAVIV